MCVSTGCVSYIMMIFNNLGSLVLLAKPRVLEGLFCRVPLGGINLQQFLCSSGGRGRVRLVPRGGPWPCVRAGGSPRAKAGVDVRVGRVGREACCGLACTHGVAAPGQCEEE